MYCFVNCRSCPLLKVAPRQLSSQFRNFYFGSLLLAPKIVMLHALTRKESPMKHWIVVADASGARVFSIAGRNKPLELVREFYNPDGRLRTQDLVSDESGRYSKNGAPGTRSAMQPRTSAHDDAADVFVRELANYLREGLGR